MLPEKWSHGHRQDLVSQMLLIGMEWIRKIWEGSKWGLVTVTFNHTTDNHTFQRTNSFHIEWTFLEFRMIGSVYNVLRGAFVSRDWISYIRSCRSKSWWSRRKISLKFSTPQHRKWRILRQLHRRNIGIYVSQTAPSHFAMAWLLSWLWSIFTC